MKWIKKGLIYKPDGCSYWNKSHVQVPVAQLINDDIIRIFYASRDQQNQSRISYIDVKADNPKAIIYINKDPIIDLGTTGAFDDSGMMPSCIIQHNNKHYLYYIGWNIRKSVPFHNSIGLAISEDEGKTFFRFSEGPIIDRTYKEPYFSGTSYVLKENDTFKMWYLSCVKWSLIDNKQEPFYNIKYAESNNGLDWKREGLVAIELKDNEAAIASASVYKINDIYNMWYSFRGAKEYRTNKENSYRIGYATSYDGIIWTRKDDEVGIEMSDSGWDSEMNCYPNVIKVKNKFYMFYNGNGFGKSGFGYAELET